MSLCIREIQSPEINDFLSHFARHMAENAQDGSLPFAPYARNTPVELAGRAESWQKRLALQSADPGFARIWGLFDAENICRGHVDLGSSPLLSMRHRVVLGVGIEKAHRARGHGRRLLNVAIDFAKRDAGLRWIDLCVFSHQQRAKALYQKMGFGENGLVRERFIIDEHPVDDVSMTLFVGCKVSEEVPESDKSKKEA